jgi:hypothetical protein
LKLIFHVVDLQIFLFAVHVHFDFGVCLPF